MQPSQNHKISGIWKTLIASLSVTTLVGLVNLFSNRDAKSANAQVIEALLNNPVPTLVPAAQVTITAPPQSESSATAPAAAPTAMPVIAPTFAAPVAQPAYVPPTAYQPAPAPAASNPAPAVTKATTPKKTTTKKPATKTSSSKK
jgi:hypothetical protein